MSNDAPVCGAREPRKATLDETLTGPVASWASPFPEPQSLMDKLEVLPHLPRLTGAHAALAVQEPFWANCAYVSGSICSASTARCTSSHSPSGRRPFAVSSPARHSHANPVARVQSSAAPK